MEENTELNVFQAKTVEEAIETGLQALGLDREQAEIEVLDEGKKKLFGGVKAKVRITEKLSDGKRAANFIDGLFGVLKINAFSEIVNDGEKIEINIQTTHSHSVIGRRGEILDAIQCIAGAVANIGRDEYKKVVVDCENYRQGREQTLVALAEKLAKKAVEKGRKVKLEPMNPYERRIIHSALAESAEVKTVSDGKEPNRYVVIIPNNLKPYERREGRFRSEKRDFNRDKKPYGDKKPYDGKRDFRRDRRDGGNRGERQGSSSRPARGKKEIHFGAFLGNSGNKGGEGNSEE